MAITRSNSHLRERLPHTPFNSDVNPHVDPVTAARKYHPTPFRNNPTWLLRDGFTTASWNSGGEGLYFEEGQLH